jgi:hypothetical protein
MKEAPIDIFGVHLAGHWTSPTPEMRERGLLRVLGL